ncbi:hypothetical protein ACVFI8_06070 [Agarivorans sp. MS3-6]
MKVIKLGLVVSMMGLLGCAATNQKVEEIALNYQPNPPSVVTETTKQLLVERCNKRVSSVSYLQTHCYVVGDVLVIEHRLRDKRREWNANSISDSQLRLANNVCNSHVEFGALQDGMGYMVNFTGGRNGLPTRVITIEDCNEA